MFSYFKRFAQQILTYGLGDTINKIISILIVPLFTRYLTPTDYGVAGVLLVTSTLLLGICDLGLSNGVTRFFHEKEKKSEVISTAQIAMVAVSGLIALLAWPFAARISEVFFSSSQYSYYVFLTFLTIPLTLMNTAPMMRWRLEEKAKIYAFFNVAKVITGVTLNIVLIVFLNRGLAGLFEGPLINAAFYALVIGGYSFYKNGVKFNWSYFKEMMVFSIPFVFGLLAFWVMDWADRFILARMTSLHEVGLYNLGYSVGMAIMLPVGAFATAWPPFFISIKDQEEAPKIYSLAFTYYSLIICFLVLILAVFSRDYFYFFTPAEYHDAYIVVPLVALAYAFKGHFSIASVGGFLKKKTIFQLVSDIIATAVNIVAMFILIPYLGRMGAAWATLIAYAALPILMYLLTSKIYPIKYEYGRLGLIMVVGLIIYGLCTVFYQPTLTNVILRAIVLLLYPIVFWLIGFFSPQEIKRLRNLKKGFLNRQIEAEVNEAAK